MTDLCECVAPDQRRRSPPGVTLSRASGPPAQPVSSLHTPGRLQTQVIEVEGRGQESQALLEIKIQIVI